MSKITDLEYARAGIETRFLGPTNHRGARAKALRTDHGWEDAGRTIEMVIPWDHSLNPFENHRAVAQLLAERLGWDTDRHVWTGVAGTLRGYVFTMKAGA